MWSGLLPTEACILINGFLFQGLVEEEKLDTYNTPYYEPYTEDIKAEIEKEGSFNIDHIATIVIPWDGCNGGMKCDRVTTAKNMGKAIRAVNESMIRSHFGEEILDHLFQTFSEIMAADTKEVEHVSVVVSVIRNDGTCTIWWLKSELVILLLSLIHNCLLCKTYGSRFY